MSCVSLVLGRQTAADPSKILRGLDALNTNKFLQDIALAGIFLLFHFFLNSLTCSPNISKRLRIDGFAPETTEW